MIAERSPMLLYIPMEHIRVSILCSKITVSLQPHLPGGGGKGRKEGGDKARGKGEESLEIQTTPRIHLVARQSRGGISMKRLNCFYPS